MNSHLTAASLKQLIKKRFHKNIGETMVMDRLGDGYYLLCVFLSDRQGHASETFKNLKTNTNPYMKRFYTTFDSYSTHGTHGDILRVENMEKWVEYCFKPTIPKVLEKISKKLKALTVIEEYEEDQSYFLTALTQEDKNLSEIISNLNHEDSRYVLVRRNKLTTEFEMDSPKNREKMREIVAARDLLETFFLEEMKVKTNWQEHEDDEDSNNFEELSKMIHEDDEDYRKERRAIAGRDDLPDHLIEKLVGRLKRDD